MMAPRVNITDRAKRYRAQQNVTGPKKCVICGSTRNLDVMHLDGNEAHGEKENLAYGCRSCNNRLAAAFKRAGIGVPTNQYNPGGVPTFEQYAWAVTAGERDYYPNSTRHASGVHDEAGAIIHATPKSKRIEYAARLARHSNPAQNPANEVYKGTLYSPGKRAGGSPFRVDGASFASQASLDKWVAWSLGTKSAKAGKWYVETDTPEGGERVNPWFGSTHKHYTRKGSGKFHLVGGNKSPDDLNAEFLKKEKEKPVKRGKVREESVDMSKGSRAERELEARNERAVREGRRSNPKKFDRCVKDVKAKGGAANAYAVCTAAGTRNNPVEGQTYDLEQAKMTADWLKHHGHVGVKIIKRGRHSRYPYTSGPTSKPGKKTTQEPVYVITSRGQLTRNPATASAEVFEEFHGFPPSEVITVTRQVHQHTHVAAAGELAGLKVKPINRSAIRTLEFGDDCFLTFNELKTQLFITGGDQRMSKAELKKFGVTEDHELHTIGKLWKVGYFTNKTHLGDEGGEAVYSHTFRTTNENGKHVTVRIARYPDLIYRTLDEQFEISGGSYEILREGIDK